MKRFIPFAALLGLLIAVPLCGVYAADDKDEKEEKIKFSDAPAAVQETMKEESHGAKIETVEKEKEKGKWVFEAEDVMIKGKPYEIEVAEDGTLICKKLQSEDDDDDDDDDKNEGKDDDDKDDKEEAKKAK